MSNKNRRTLARRISRTTWLCVFLAITVFTATVSFLSVRMAKQNGAFFAGVFANVVADKLSSPEFLEYLGVDDLSQVRPGSTAAMAMHLGMKDFESNAYNYYLVDAASGLIMTVPERRQLNEFWEIPESKTSTVSDLGIVSFRDMAQISIIINGSLVYRSDYLGRSSPETTGYMNPNSVTPAMQKVIDFFSTEASYFIPDGEGISLGEVQVKFNPKLNLLFYVTLFIGILSAALASYLASVIMISIFTKTVAKPFVTLAGNLDSLAQGNYDDLLNSHIQVKKPLKEIQSMANSTNIILDKMHEFNHIISAQNELLEKQNAELESQNEELTESRKQIHTAQTQLVQNQNMASVGQLTAAISHEINTPLGTINSNVQLQNMILDMLLSKPELINDDEIMRLLSQMHETGSTSAKSCNQVSLIIRSLKNFSRLDQADFQETDINESARSVVLLTRYLWKERVTLREEYGNVPFVKCYPGLLNQVFMNILVNAIHAIPDKGEIIIKTWHDGEYIRASIKDNGMGMDKEKLDNLFIDDYGFDSNTSKMGFSICKNIMDKHNGFITVKSQSGEGTEVTIAIPINQE